MTYPTTLTLRLVKNSQLSTADLDNNFTALDSSIDSASRNLLPKNNTWTGTNSFADSSTFAGIVMAAIANNGDGTDAPTPAISNTITQDITGVGANALLGQSLPALVKDTGTYNLDHANGISIGALFDASPTINFSDSPPYFGIAGGYSALLSACNFDNTRTGVEPTSSLSFANTAIKIGNTFQTSGEQVFNIYEYGLNHAPTLDSGVTGQTICTALSTPPVLNGTATVSDAVGFASLPRDIANHCNAGFSYAALTDLPNDGREYSFFSNRGIQQTGGGRIKKFSTAVGGSTLTSAHHIVHATGGNGFYTLTLPSAAVAGAGTEYVIFNEFNAGLVQKVCTVESTSAFVGVAATGSDADEINYRLTGTFISDGTNWLRIY